MVDEKAKFKMRKILEELRKYRGAHTELVTVYIPADYDLNKIINTLQQEQGTASNIKSASTRKNVIDALEKMIQHLRLFRQTPPNGLAVFSGNVASMEGKSDLRVWSVEPPVPLKQKLYRCDKEFILGPLEELSTETDVYGLIVMDRRECTIALLKGKTIIPIAQSSSWVPGKFKTGGQSAQRFSRIRENAAYEFYKKVADQMTETFLPMLNEIKGIILGGPGPTKYELMESGYIPENIKAKIIGIKDITYTDEFGLHELLDRSQDLLAEASIAEEKKIMMKFFDLLNKKPGMVAYGKDDIIKYLDMSVVETVLVSETVDTTVIDELDEKAKKTGAELKIISTQTREGAQLKAMGGFAAILRYEASI